MKKILAILFVLCLLLTAAGAELYAPSIEERLTDTVPEDFVGCWEMFMCTSGKPVDMRSYYFVQIHDDGHAVVDCGNSGGEVWYETKVQQPENGVLYIADENGENGAYYFLFDESLMGCAKTMDAPDTIIYLECVLEEPWSENSWREENYAAILSEVGEVTPVMDVQDCIGAWCGWATTSAETGRLILNPEYFITTLTVSEQKATLSVSAAGEMQVSEMAIETTDQGVSFYNEEDDSRYWFFLRGEDEMVLLDDPEMPVAALYFYTPERWEQEEANGAFVTGPELTEPIAVTSIEQAVGKWEATHTNFIGYVETMNSGMLSLEIKEDGSALMLEEDSEPMLLTVDVQDGYLILKDAEGYSWHFRLHENGILVQALDGDDFSVSIYFRREIAE